MVSESVCRSNFIDMSAYSNTLICGLYVPVATTYFPSLVVFIRLEASGNSKS